MTWRRACRIGLVGLLLALLPGCAANVAREFSWEDEGRLLRWPAEPLPPKVKFLKTLRGSKDFAAEETQGRLFTWFFGDSNPLHQLLRPAAVTADGAGRVWVADTALRSIFKFDLAREQVEAVTQAEGLPLGLPVGLAYDRSAARLYAADADNRRVYVFDDDFVQQGVLVAPGGFTRPGGLALDGSGNLFVADAGRGVIEVFDNAGRHQRTIFSQVTEDGKFRLPTYLAIGPAGELAIVDSLQFHVEVQSADGALVAVVGGLGDAPGFFARPRGVGFDQDGHLYVADAAFDNIQVFDMAGRLLLFIGGAGRDAGQFNLPAGLYVDSQDRIYIADSYNHRVQILQYLGGD